LGIKQFHRISNPCFDEEWDNSSAHDDDQTNHQVKSTIDTPVHALLNEADDSQVKKDIPDR